MLDERIRELRTAKRVSQVELAQRLGITKQCVSNWENNNIQPSLEMLVKLADFFHVSTDYLLGLDNRKRLEVEGLTNLQLAHIRQIIEDILEK